MDGDGPGFGARLNSRDGMEGLVERLEWRDSKTMEERASSEALD